MFNGLKNIWERAGNALGGVGYNAFMPRESRRQRKISEDLDSQLSVLREQNKLRREKNPFVTFIPQNDPRFNQSFNPSKQLVASMPPTQAPTYKRNNPYRNIVNNSAAKYKIDPRFLDSLVFAESSYNPKALSKSGAYGLTQIMPATLKGLGYMGDPTQLTPQQQIDYGAQYLNQIYNIRKRRLGRAPTPLEWYHAYSFGPYNKKPISPEYKANWERAYGGF